MPEFDVQFVDDGPPPSDPVTTSPPSERPKTAQCAECGDTFDVSSRGRVPTKCPKHRKGGGGGTIRKGGRRKARKSIGEYARLAHEAITGLLVQPLAIVGMGTKHPGPLATSFTVGYQCQQQTAYDEKGQEFPVTSEYGPLPDAIGELATHHDKLADILETFDTALPYVKLTAALLPIVPQTLANFGIVKPGAFGTADPNVIADVVRNQMVAAMSASFQDFGGMFAEAAASNGASAN